jgi:hypothetical protein
MRKDTFRNYRSHLSCRPDNYPEKIELFSKTIFYSLPLKRIKKSNIEINNSHQGIQGNYNKSDPELYIEKIVKINIITE